MGVLSNLKSRVSNAVNKLKNKLKPSSGGGSAGGGAGGGGGSSWGGPAPTSSKVSIPKVSADGPMSVDPNSNKAKVANAAKSSSLASPNYNYGLPDQSLNKIIKNATGGKSGGMSYAPGAAGGMSMPIGSITTSTKSKSSSKSYVPSSMSLASSDYDYGLGGGSDAFSSLAFSSGGGSPTSSSRVGSTGSKVGSASTGGGGASGSAGDLEDMSPAAQLERIRKQLLDAQRLLNNDQSAADGAITSDSEIVQQEREAEKMLKRLMKPDDRSLEILDREIERNERLMREREASIGAGFDAEKANIAGQQLNETGQYSAMLANAGGYLGFTGSGTGVMLKLAESHRAEIMTLEAKRQQAITEARDAAQQRRFDIVSMKVDEIARIDNEKYERTNDYYNRVKAQADTEREKAEELQTQNLVFEAIQSGNKTPSDIFRALKGKVPVQEITSFLEGIDKSSGSLFKFSASEATSLLGAGMSADDVSALSEAVNEYGYTEEIRAQLTPSQRAAADKIYRGKTGASSSTAFTTKDGVAVSDTTLQVLDGFTSLKSLTPTVREKVKSQLYALGFNNERIPEWFDADAVEELVGEQINLEMLEAHYRFSSAVGFEAENLEKFGKRFIKEMWESYRNRILSQDEDLENSAGLSTDLNEIKLSSIPS